MKKETLWPVKGPTPLPGSILPERRIVAFYGNPLSTRMGILGELKPDQMLARLDREVEAWRKADPETPVQPPSIGIFSRLSDVDVIQDLAITGDHVWVAPYDRCVLVMPSQRLSRGLTAVRLGRFVQ